MDTVIINVKSVEAKTSSNNKSYQLVIGQDDVRYSNWGKPMTAPLAYNCNVETKETNGKTYRTIKSFTPMSEAVPPPTTPHMTAYAKPAPTPAALQPNGQEMALCWKMLGDFLMTPNFFPPAIQESLKNVVVTRVIEKLDIPYDYLKEMVKVKLQGKTKTKEPEVVNVEGTVEDAAHLFK